MHPVLEQSSPNERTQESLPGSEQRHAQRYPVTEGLFGFLRPEGSILGTVQDVSRSGFGLNYVILDGKEPPEGSAEPIEVKLFKLGHAYALSGLHCRLVYDRPLPKPWASVDSLTQNRRCGMQFLHLTEEQKAGLEELIREHTAA